MTCARSFAKEPMKTRITRTVHRIETLDPRVLALTLNALALCVFFFVALRYNYLHPDNIGRLMFSTPDTWKYRAIADWLFGKTGSFSPALVLPVLYPLFLGSVWRIAGNPYVFWAVQFSLWIAAINLTAAAVYRTTKRKMVMAIAFGIMMLNLSAIVMTFYALPEIMVIFLSSIFVYVLSGTDLRDPAPRDAFWLTFLLSLLAITKPVFQLHLALWVAFIFYQSIRRHKTILSVGLALIPVALQIGVNAHLYGVVGISNLSETTARWYILSQVYAARNTISLQEARSIVNDYDGIRIAGYLIQDPAATLSAYLQNLRENLTGASDSLEFYPKPYIFTRWTNIGYLIVQIIFLPAMIYILFANKDPRALAIKLLYLFSGLTIFTAAISFNEGDRLVLSALPLWIYIYAGAPVLFFNPLNASDKGDTHAILTS